MQLNEKILLLYPELIDMNNSENQLYSLQNDSDGRGTYIKEWGYNKPQPTQEQLDALDDNT